MKNNQATRNQTNYKQEQIAKNTNQSSFFKSLFLPFTVNQTAREYLKYSEKSQEKLEQRLNKMNEKMEKDMEEISAKLEALESKTTTPSI